MWRLFASICGWGACDRRKGSPVSEKGACSKYRSHVQERWSHVIEERVHLLVKREHVSEKRSHVQERWSHVIEERAHLPVKRAHVASTGRMYKRIGHIHAKKGLIYL
ncbi:hypothetical protein [Ornithinibacillus sp. FSL M8-0202]|uniref:hypothetical protein n=1 Tax=Ornithinibacillus sp. FSL M8-0202 TaxID=2921616 RepID=UPI0030CEB420